MVAIGSATTRRFTMRTRFVPLFGLLFAAFAFFMFAPPSGDSIGSEPTVVPATDDAVPMMAREDGPACLKYCAELCVDARNKVYCCRWENDCNPRAAVASSEFESEVEEIEDLEPMGGGKFCPCGCDTTREECHYVCTEVKKNKCVRWRRVCENVCVSCVYCGRP